MLICIYTMCQYTAAEPASVQTLIFTHRYGINVFSSSILILLSIVFTGMHAGIYLCVQLLLCGQKLCKYRQLQWKYLLLYEQTYV